MSKPNGSGGKKGDKPDKAAKPRDGITFRRFITLRNGRVLDAWQYGHKAWLLVLADRRVRLGLPDRCTESGGRLCRRRTSYDHTSCIEPCPTITLRRAAPLFAHELLLHALVVFPHLCWICSYSSQLM